MKKLLSVAFIAMLLLTMMPSVVTAPAKAATKTLTITWNYNGGKIGRDIKTATKLKKGAKIGKLPEIPTYTGYTFKGWFTKKTGGTKVTVSTKPTKDVTYYAQWKNGSATPAPTVKPTLTPIAKPTPTPVLNQLVGMWEFMMNYWVFNADGTFQYIRSDPVFVNSGSYTTSNGNINIFNIKNKVYTNIIYKDQTLPYSFGTDSEGEYLYIAQYEALSNEYGGDVSTYTQKIWRRYK